MRTVIAHGGQPPASSGDRRVPGKTLIRLPALGRLEMRLHWTDCFHLVLMDGTGQRSDIAQDRLMKLKKVMTPSNLSISN